MQQANQRIEVDLLKMKTGRMVFAICAAIFLLGLTGSFYLLQRSSTDIVEILQDGTTLYRIDLSKQCHAQRIEIACDSGTNVIHIGADGVYMESASCADQSCVKMGTLRSTALPIVCLPHRLIVQYSNSNSDEEIDGAS